MAGTSRVARRFPVRIGRGDTCELRLEDPGVWDQHLTLGLTPGLGFCLQTEANALARVNGQPLSQTVLRNGDTIELGAVRIQFWLSAVRQRGLLLREAVSWGMIAAALLGQLGLLYWLLQ